MKIKHKKRVGKNKSESYALDQAWRCTCIVILYAKSGRVLNAASTVTMVTMMTMAMSIWMTMPATMMMATMAMLEICFMPMVLDANVWERVEVGGRGTIYIRQKALTCYAYGSRC